MKDALSNPLPNSSYSLRHKCQNHTKTYKNNVQTCLSTSSLYCLSLQVYMLTLSCSMLTSNQTAQPHVCRLYITSVKTHSPSPFPGKAASCLALPKSGPGRITKLQLHNCNKYMIQFQWPEAWADFSLSQKQLNASSKILPLSFSCPQNSVRMQISCGSGFAQTGRHILTSLIASSVQLRLQRQSLATC